MQVQIVIWADSQDDIQRYSRKKKTESEVERLGALMEKRERLEVGGEEEIDGVDWDGLRREFNVAR